VLCAAGALIGVTTSADGFLPFLCVLVGGWALAFGTVNALAGLGARAAWSVHGALVVAAVALLVALVPLLGSLGSTARPGGLAEPVARALGLLALAVPPACGWVLITFLGRISSVFDGAAARRAAAMPRYAWSGSDSRPEVRFTAARFSTRRLAALTVVTTLVGGLAATVVMIAAQHWLNRWPPLAVIVLLGVVIGLPLYAVVWAIVNRHPETVVVRWSTGALQIETDESWTVPFYTVRRFVWRERGEMARIEVHTDRRHETFLVGMVRQDAGAVAELPALQHRMTRALEHAGLERHERRGAVRFERAAGAISVGDAPPGRG